MTAEWPVRLRGVTESVVATQGPNGRWNLGALGLQAPGEEGDGARDTSEGRVTARTWGRTRTRRNFGERGRGYVQFTRDPVVFVEAALGVLERDEPLLPTGDARVEVAVERVAAGESEGTDWIDWALEPVESVVEREIVPTTNRGYNAVVEGTVAASRLDVPAYESAALLDRLSHFEGVVDRCGGPAEREAWATLRELVDADW